MNYKGNKKDIRVLAVPPAVVVPYAVVEASLHAEIQFVYPAAGVPAVTSLCDYI